MKLDVSFYNFRSDGVHFKFIIGIQGELTYREDFSAPFYTLKFGIQYFYKNVNVTNLLKNLDLVNTNYNKLEKLCDLYLINPEIVYDINLRKILS